MDRRGFLKTLAAGIAAASVASPVLAAVSNAITVDPYEKYKVALSMLDDIVEMNKFTKIRTENGHPIYDEHACKTMTAKFDELLAFVHENWTAPANTDEEKIICRQVLHWEEDKTSGDFVEEMRKIPPTILDTVWPIALARLGIRDYKLALRPQYISEYKTFNNRYGDLIFGRLGR